MKTCISSNIDIIYLMQYNFFYRLDSTLIDFADMKWQRGDISIIFNGEAEGLYDPRVHSNTVLLTYQPINACFLRMWDLC